METQQSNVSKVSISMETGINKQLNSKCPTRLLFLHLFLPFILSPRISPLQEIGKPEEIHNLSFTIKEGAEHWCISIKTDTTLKYDKLIMIMMLWPIIYNVINFIIQEKFNSIEIHFTSALNDLI